MKRRSTHAEQRATNSVDTCDFGVILLRSAWHIHLPQRARADLETLGVAAVEVQRVGLTIKTLSRVASLSLIFRRRSQTLHSIQDTGDRARKNKNKKNENNNKKHM